MEKNRILTHTAYLMRREPKLALWNIHSTVGSQVFLQFSESVAFMWRNLEMSFLATCLCSEVVVVVVVVVVVAVVLKMSEWRSKDLYVQI